MQDLFSSSGPINKAAAKGRRCKCLRDLVCVKHKSRESPACLQTIKTPFRLPRVTCFRARKTTCLLNQNGSVTLDVFGIQFDPTRSIKPDRDVDKIKNVEHSGTSNNYNNYEKNMLELNFLK